MTDRQAFHTAVLLGAAEGDYPEWETTQAEWDAELVAERVTPELRLLQELGVA